VNGKSSVESLGLFRQFMMDIMASLSFGYRLSAVSRWALGSEDPLCTAVADFPKRGIVVSLDSLVAFSLTPLPFSGALSLPGSGTSSASSPTLDGDNFATLIRLWLR
jgi:hypothetical protein